MSRVLLACGGTGGHIAPGIALAQRLTDDGHSCVLVVSRKTVDTRMTADYLSGAERDSAIRQGGRPEDFGLSDDWKVIVGRGWEPRLAGPH